MMESPKIHVLVTTLNPDKLAAVKNAFESKIKEPIHVSGCSTNSGVPDGQPYGLDGTYQGALQRLSRLEDENADFLVSIENGITCLNDNKGTHCLDFPIVVIIERKTGKESVHFGGSRPIPLSKIREMKREGKDEKEIGEWCNTFFNSTPWASRQKIIEDALIMALNDLISS